jgi:hypothetical protein
MTTQFQINDPSLESQWRAIILFGKNSATYKFAFAKSLLGLVEKEKTRISIDELAIPFVNSIVEHLVKSDKQGNPQLRPYFVLTSLLLHCYFIVTS